MTKERDSIQDAGNGQLDGMTLDFTTTIQAIFAEGVDYTKKSVESRLALGAKLLGAKSLETVIQIQMEYAKSAYADFVAQAAKMGELHSRLAKAAFKPAELTFAKVPGTKYDTMVQAQSESAKTAYDAFVAQTTKLGELYSNLAMGTK